MVYDNRYTNKRNGKGKVSAVTLTFGDTNPCHPVRYGQSEQDTRTKAMRKFLSSTEGASFNEELPTQTVCVRKDCVDKTHHPSSISHHTSSDCKPDGTMYHGFSLKVDIPSKRALLECITPEIFSKGRLLANKCLKMYMELHNNPPFPAWKDGLGEVFA